MMKTILWCLFVLGASAPAFALMVEVDKYDSKESYSVALGTKNVVYLENCSRKKINFFQWRIWEDFYGVTAIINPVATITIKRELDEFTIDPQPFIVKAIQTSAEVGGNIICYVTSKKNPDTYMLESMTFRAYMQYFKSGSDAYKTYYTEKVTDGLPLTLQDLDLDKK